MNTIAAAPPTWAATAMDVTALQEHIDRCNGSRERWFMLRCTADAIHDFVAPRFVTTLFIVGALIGVAAFAA
jgi:hypothetical protein